MAIGIGILESPFGQRWTSKQLFQSLEKMGIQVEAGSVRGGLSKEIEAKRVVLQSKDNLPLTIDHVRLHVALLPLLRQELSLKGEATGLKWNEKEVEGPLTFALKGHRDQEILQGRFEGSLEGWTFQGRIEKRGEGPLQVVHATANTSNLELQGSAEFGAEGLLKGTVRAQSHFEMGDLFTSIQLTREEASLKIEGFWQAPKIETAEIKLSEAKGNLKGIWENGNFLGESTFSAYALNEFLEGSAKVQYHLKGTLILDPIQVNAPSLQGTGVASRTSEGIWTGRFDATSIHLSLLQFFHPSLTSTGNGSGTVWLEPGGLRLSLVSQNAHVGNFRAEESTLSASWTAPSQIEGTLQLERAHVGPLALDTLHLSTKRTEAGKSAPFQLETTGELSLAMQGEWSPHSLSIEPFEGLLLGRPLHLRKRAQFEWDTHPFSFQELSLSLGGADGFLSISPSEKIEGRFSFQGRVEEILDWVDLGSHRLEGNCTIDLTLGGTLSHPLLEGFVRLDEGLYQNYWTGTEIRDIKAEVLAEKHTLYLKHLVGQDGQKKGSLEGTGELSLNWKERFPFHASLRFARLNVTQIDLVSAEAEGSVEVTGNLDGATAKGEVSLLETDITIPNFIARPLPELQVVYKHGKKSVISPPISSSLRTPYPLHLDLKLDAKDGIFIGGRGLNSEWKGAFHVKGTYTAVEANGKVELLSGEFVFAGRTFKLTEGALSLRGMESPLLNIAGEMNEKGVLITARLRGPLNQPQLTFQSTPPLPLSGILSYLLFGQDLSEINSFQALQLASSAAMLAGEGADVLEGTRKSLGIDRFQIRSSPSDEGETLSIEVGKYIAKGVIVSFSQGADDSSSNISIEVDLTHGFIFQAETQQQEEQGKFSLKWHRAY